MEVKLGEIPYYHDKAPEYNFPRIEDVSIDSLEKLEQGLRRCAELLPDDLKAHWTNSRQEIQVLGGYATGNAQPMSDIDISFVVPDDVSDGVWKSITQTRRKAEDLYDFDQAIYKLSYELRIRIEWGFGKDSRRYKDDIDQHLSCYSFNDKMLYGRRLGGIDTIRTRYDEATEGRSRVPYKRRVYVSYRDKMKKSNGASTETNIRS